MTVSGLHEQARALATGAVSSEHLVGEAAEADRRLAAGERLTLLGVPVAVKDDVDVAGETTPFACPGRHLPRGADSEVVACLRRAGAIVVGKTTASQFGRWKSGQRSAAAAPFAWAWNVLGWPAVSVPAGFAVAGLPIGAQLLGRQDDETTLLALAAQLEEASGWTAWRP